MPRAPNLGSLGFQVFVFVLYMVHNEYVRIPDEESMEETAPWSDARAEPHLANPHYEVASTSFAPAGN